MIELVASRTGIPVLRQNGKWLASSVDPIKEAVRWAQDVLGQCDGAESVVVLGAGSGYHIIELARLAPHLQIVLIEPESDRVSTVNRSVAGFAEIPNLKVVIENDPLKLTAHLAVQDLLTSIYVIGGHGPSMSLDTDWSYSMTRFFVARDRISFLLQLRTRPELFALFDPDKIASLGDQPISIKTIQKLFRADAGRHVERRVWRVLEELVL